MGQADYVGPRGCLKIRLIRKVKTLMGRKGGLALCAFPYRMIDF